MQHTAARCNTLQHTATHCNTLQHTVTHCNTLQHTAAHCSTLHHTATHCNTLQLTANTLQHTATHDRITVPLHESSVLPSSPPSTAMFDTTYSKAWLDSFICMTSHIYCNVWHDSIICDSWFIHCNIWHDSWLTLIFEYYSNMNLYMRTNMNLYMRTNMNLYMRTNMNLYMRTNMNLYMTHAHIWILFKYEFVYMKNSYTNLYFSGAYIYSSMHLCRYMYIFKPQWCICIYQYVCVHNWGVLT